MARPKATVPRSVSILVRLTQPQTAVLDAMASVERSNRAQIVLGMVEAALTEAARDDLIQAQLELHARFDAREAAKVIDINRSDGNP